MKIVKVKVLPYYPPRKSERTFSVKMGSVGYAGRKKITLRKMGLKGSRLAN